MKKIATLILAAGLVFGAATGSSAIEFNAKGQWIMGFELGHGGSGTSAPAGSGYGRLSPDDFEAEQRIRLQLDAVASEALSGTILFEMGETTWGRQASGGALGTDGAIVEIKSAYIDWMVPNTALKIRMGLQGVALPSYTFNASEVFNNDVAAIVASYQFNDNIGVTAFWARPVNDNFGGDGRQAANILDNIDIFSLIVPMTFNNLKIAPWGAFAMIGRNSLAPAGANNATNAFAGNGYFPMFANGMLPAVTYRNGDENRRSSYGSAYWLGLTGEYAVDNGLRFAWDANYGAVDTGITHDKRQGWYVDALVEYKMAWGTPGLYAWYGSGDDNSAANGSERMPSFSSDGNDERSNLAGTGNPYIGREGVLARQWTGTWGIGARLKDMSFMEDLKHTLRVNYIQGTNNTRMARFITQGTANPDLPIPAVVGVTATNGGVTATNYMTTADHAIEVGLTNTYKIYDNLTMFTDLGYIFLNMDNSVWNNVSRTDPWNVNVSFVYSF